MANDTETDEAATVAAEPRKTWQPSLRPTYHAGQAPISEAGSIVERPDSRGMIGTLRAWVRRPFVKLIIGMGLFILASIVYDATVNFGSWTERAEKPKAGEHRGVPRGR